MTGKPASPAAMRRRIERLEAEVAATRESTRRMHEIYSDMLEKSVDYQIRVQQALRILQGADE